MALSGKGFTKPYNIISQAAITANFTGPFKKVPPGKNGYYIKITATEVQAGGITVEVRGNESASTTDSYLIHTATFADTGIVRVGDVDSSAGFDYLAPYVYVACTSVTGRWTIVVDLVTRRV